MQVAVLNKLKVSVPDIPTNARDDYCAFRVFHVNYAPFIRVIHMHVVFRFLGISCSLGHR